MRTLPFALLLLTVPQLSSTAHAQDALDEARAQYEAASYEEALATLTRVEDASAPADRVQVEQYRALCLIALGNIDDAERAVAALVAADPTYVPSASVASPKVLSLVAEIRRKELPLVARGLLDAGRNAFQAKDLTRAQQHFGLLLKLLDDPAMAGRPEKEDMRTLAEGFVTLALAASAPPASAPPPGAPLTSVPTPAVSAPLSAPATEQRTSRPAARIATNVSAPPAAPAPGAFVPATAIDQVMPEWEPPSQVIAGFEYNGRLRLRIGANGSVISAVVDKPSHPLYDARLLEMAPTWRYMPATRNGVPVESERVIVVTLRARW